MVPLEQDCLMTAHRQTARIRSFEEVTLVLGTGADPHIAGSVHTCIGQEAVPVGTLAALQPDDQVIAIHRGHGWALQSGVEPYELLAKLCGGIFGAALCGRRPIVEIMRADFLLVALDQFIDQTANVLYLTQGRCSVPLVVRTQQGATPGSCAQHSQNLEALLAHIPGPCLELPTPPQDAYEMLRAAVADPDPCIIVEA